MVIQLLLHFKLLRSTNHNIYIYIYKMYFHFYGLMTMTALSSSLTSFTMSNTILKHFYIRDAQTQQ